MAKSAIGVMFGLGAAALVALVPVGAGSADAPTDQVIEVRLTNFAFTPNVLRLRSGTPYRLHLVNAAPGGHAFAARELFANSTIAPQDQAKIEDGKIEVRKGASVDVEFTPFKTGSYPIRCTHPLHATFGMTGQAVVE